MTFPGNLLQTRGQGVRRLLRAAISALALLACVSGLHAEPTGQVVVGDGNNTFQNIQDSQITINNGLSPDEVRSIREALLSKREIDATTRKKLEDLSRELHLTKEIIANFFRELSGDGDLQENWPKKLAQYAEDYRKLREQIKTLDPDDPGLKALSDQALVAIDAGRLDEAKDLLTRIDQQEDPGVIQAQKLLLKKAETKAALGRVAVLQRQYLDAAAHFRAASDVLPGAETARRREYREAEAGAYYREGEERGDNQALGHTIALYRVLLQETPRERVPPAWAATQTNLGNALWTLGARESDTARLEQAVDAYRAALQEYTRERAPLDWAMTQNNLGNALATLGERPDAAGAGCRRLSRRAAGIYP
jgi:tetratricopeptide (TPR) repeat protein